MKNQELYELELRLAAQAVAAGDTDVTPAPTRYRSFVSETLHDSP
jgi:hypothetical protein